MEKRIGIVGVGAMGKPAARAFLAAGWETTVYDMDEKSVAELKSEGCLVAGSPAELTEHTRIALIFLPGPPQVKAVTAGENGLLYGDTDGLIVVDMSTVDPYSTRENESAARRKGVSYLDAPILGRPHRCGKWTLPIGGDPAAFETVSPVLSVVAEKQIYLGESGSGNIVKVLNNMMFGAINTVTAEIMALAEKVGFSTKRLYDVLAESGAASVSPLFKELAPKIYNDEYEPNFSVDLMQKDLSLGLIMGEKSGVPLYVTQSSHKVCEEAQTLGLNREDSAAVVKVYRSKGRSEA